MIEFISIFIIAWGVLLALYRIVALALENYRVDVDMRGGWLRLRRTFGEIMLLGLQFLVAADIILTICNPDLQTVSVLAAIVIIRVVLSVSLGKEIHGLEERDADAKRHAPPRYDYRRFPSREKFPSRFRPPRRATGIFPPPAPNRRRASAPSGACAALCAGLSSPRNRER